MGTISHLQKGCLQASRPLNPFCAGECKLQTRVGTCHCPSLFDHGTILSQMGQGWGEVGEAELIKYGIEPCLCLKF